MVHKLGVIGGSGLYQMEALTDVEEVVVDTPFGPPSDALITGQLDGVEVVFLARHGRGHTLTPSEVPYRANLWALKSLGVDWVLSVSAVGSLREAIVPGHLVIVDQFIDRTKDRVSSFFGDGCVAHVPFGDPVCSTLRQLLLTAARSTEATVHDGGTYVAMEGPAFSTRAESNLYRSWGADVIGMTNLPEAKLAREAELCYATVAMVTDFDSWHDDHDNVDVASVLAVMKSNTEKAQALVLQLAKLFPREHQPCPIGSDRALDVALITAPEARDPALVAKLDAVAGRVLG